MSIFRYTFMVFSSLVILLTTTVAIGAKTVQQPLNPVINKQPMLLKKLQFAPILERISPSKCLVPGSKITLIGKHFGNLNQQGIAIAGNGVHMDLKPTQWSGEKILAWLPKTTDLKSNQRYQLRWCTRCQT